jgi:hypothetical protein
VGKDLSSSNLIEEENVMRNPAAIGTRILTGGLLPMLILAAAASSADAQSPVITRVEQDWELVVTSPDPVNDAPQMVCVISPVGHVHSLYAAFELNQRTQPDFSPGGLQLQIWDGETMLRARSSLDNVLSQNNETITWTQKMQLVDGQLIVEIADGSSATWGAFGGALRLTVNTGLSNLNGYESNVSVANSGVGYGGNRVQSLVLKRTRFITDAGQTLEDSVPKTVFPRQ